MAHRDQDELFGIPNQLVMDPVHGGIAFFEHEKLVLDHPLFQRLRWIVQNDITSLVFPGATHTRFQHSQGAMHIAGRLWKSMVRGYLSDPKISRKNKITERQASAIRYFNFLIRLAALLHDTGHFPFSHQLESSRKVRELLHDKNLFENLWAGVRWQRYYDQTPKALTHEHYSVRCAHEILSRTLVNRNEVEFHDVLALMEGTTCLTTKRFENAAWDALSLLVRSQDALTGLDRKEVAATFKNFFQNIISGELDVDKMDYLLRDSFYSGCHYGVYNLDHLLSTIRIGFAPPGAKTWVGLTITDKGIVPLEDFVYARFQLYQDLYSHKTVVGFKWLLGRAVDEIMVSDAETLSFSQKSLVNMESFSDFTDTFLWERLRSHARKLPHSAASQLLARRKLKHLVTRRDLVSFEKDKLVLELAKRNNSEVIYYESPIRFSKMSKSYEKIRVLHSNPLDEHGRRSLEAIQRHSTFFEKFQDLVISHFYVKPSLDLSTSSPRRKLSKSKKHSAA